MSKKKTDIPCTCASFYTVRGKHKKDCPQQKEIVPSLNVEWCTGNCQLTHEHLHIKKETPKGHL